MPNPFLDDDESWLDTRPDEPPPTKKRRVTPLWVVHMSHHKIAAKRGLKEGFICVGWVEAGDLSQYPTRDRMKWAFDTKYPGEKKMRVANWAGDALRFVFEMSKTDLFVFPVTGQDEIHIGEITGDYQFAAEDLELVSSDSASMRRVKWLKTVRRSAFTAAALECFDSEHTVHSGSSYREEVNKLLAITQ